MTTLNITAIGPLCGQLQEPINRVRAAIDALGIEPAMRINGVPHFNEGDCERIADHLREQREERRVFQVFKGGPQDGMKIAIVAPAVGTNRPEVGSYSSASARALSELVKPPAIRTRPS